MTIGEQGPPGLGLSFGGLAIVSASATLAPNALTPVDARGASLALTFPPATDGMVVGISDLWGASSTHPILLIAQGIGVTLADPSTPGTYASNGHIAQPGVTTYWWAFAQGTIAIPIGMWLPLWW